MAEHMPLFFPQESTGGREYWDSGCMGGLYCISLYAWKVAFGCMHWKGAGRPLSLVCHLGLPDL